MRYLLLIVCAVCCGAQPVFDAASVKLNTSGDTRSQVRIPPGGRITATNATLRALITTAYQIQDFDLEGGPGWVATNRYDIEAKAPGSPEPPEILRMLQALLAERFRLVLHQEQRQKPMYILTVSPGGPRLESPHGECNARFDASQPERQLCGGFSMRTPDIAQGVRVTMTRLAFFLARELQRPVVDKTGLSGAYDLILQWRSSPDSVDQADIFTAIREQLGLRLEAGHEPVPTMIIESVEKPSAN